MPQAILEWAEDLLGDEIIEAVSQPGGFSPGTADIVRTVGDKRAFIKAAGIELNELTPDIHRNEARISAALPPSTALPQMIASYDDGDWVALAFDVIDGEPPALPWTRADIHAALDACLVLRAIEAPPGLRPFGEAVGGYRLSWRRLLDSPEPLPVDLEPDAIATLTALAGRDPGVEGDSLLHVDLRADNVLLRSDGSAVIVDWPWAATGAPWIDPLCLLFNVLLFDSGYPVEEELRHPAFDGAMPEAIDSLLAILCGFFLGQSVLPAQKGVESVRAFQRDQALAILGWLRSRGAVP